MDSEMGYAGACDDQYGQVVATAHWPCTERGWSLRHGQVKTCEQVVATSRIGHALRGGGQCDMGMPRRMSRHVDGHVKTCEQVVATSRICPALVRTGRVFATAFTACPTHGAHCTGCAAACAAATCAVVVLHFTRTRLKSGSCLGNTKAKRTRNVSATSGTRTHTRMCTHTHARARERAAPTGCAAACAAATRAEAHPCAAALPLLPRQPQRPGVGGWQRAARPLCAPGPALCM